MCFFCPADGLFFPNEAIGKNDFLSLITKPANINIKIKTSKTAKPL